MTLHLVPVILCSLIMAAHHSRGDEPGLTGLWLTLPLVLLLRRSWADRALQFVLLAGAGEWILTINALVGMRRTAGEPYTRLVIILGVVSLATAVAGLSLNTRARRRRLPTEDHLGPGLGAFLMVGALLVPVQLVTDPAGLLAERYLHTAGWWEALVLGVYAGWLSDRLADPQSIRKLRPRVWLVFSVIFFTQFVLGLAGLEKMLMTGKLHLPVPALIAAGPLFRGGGYFMAILFTISVLLIGPAWCSWLCYIGAWDNSAASARRKPAQLPFWRSKMRVMILVLVMSTAFGLGRLGVSNVVAGWLAASFGLIGVGLMVIWSRRTGQLTHCTAYCPMGWVATRLGRISPWRLRVTDDCTDCGACTPTCRFDALSVEDVSRRRPAESCTLCGDCLSRCPTDSLVYGLPGVGAVRTRTAFFTLIAALHAVTIGVARL